MKRYRFGAFPFIRPRTVTASLLAAAVGAAGVEADAEPSPGEERVEWREEWPRFRPAEYAVAGASVAGLAAIVLFAGRRGESHEYDNPFDDAARRALRAKTRTTRDRARYLGDVGFRFLSVYPYVDSLAVAGLVHLSGDVALQTSLINTEALGLAGFVAVGFERLLGRARPSAKECAEDPGYERNCSASDRYSSFLSGHTAIAFAGAGLTCAHHTYLPLYGSRIADVTACLTAMGIASASGAASAVADRHWASDLVLAAGLGTFTGFVLPVILHYDARAAPNRRSRRRDGLRWTVVPEVAREGATLRLTLFE